MLLLNSRRGLVSKSPIFDSHPKSPKFQFLSQPNFKQQNSTITLLNMGDYREFRKGFGNQTPAFYKIKQDF